MASGYRHFQLAGENDRRRRFSGTHPDDQLFGKSPLGSCSDSIKPAAAKLFKTFDPENLICRFRSITFLAFEFVSDH